MNRENTLKIILSKKGPSSEGAGEKMPTTGDNVTAACPNHLIISDLWVAKGIGRVPAAARSPCEHAFCLECAQSSRKCYICEAQILKIDSINKVRGGIFICGLLSCLKSFRKEKALNNHIVEVHGVASSSSIIDGDGDLHLQPFNGPLPRPTAQPNP